MLFVIRADGQKIYGQSGCLSGDSLPEMLKRSQKLCGDVLSRDDQRVLKAAITQCESALKDGDLTAAANALAESESVGPFGQLNSYAKLAIRANQLAEQIGSDARNELNSLRRDLDSPKVATARLRRFDRVFGDFPVVGPELDRLFDRTTRSTSIASAEDQLNEDAATSAVAIIDSNGLSDVSLSTESLRVWTSDNGAFSLEARLVAVHDNSIELVQPDGERFSVDIDRLDLEHQNYVRGRLQ